MTDAEEQSLKEYMEPIAKEVSKMSVKELDEHFDKVDTNNFASCPSCGKKPNAWKSKDKKVGVVRCCDADVVLVTMEPNSISDCSMDKHWRKVKRLERSAE